MITSGIWEIARLALPAVTALWGGWYGARRAIDKTRADRALDRRLEWHERAFRAIADIRLTMANVRIAQRKGIKLDQEFLRAIMQSSQALDMALAERFLYATRPSLTIIDLLIGEMNRFDHGEHQMTNLAALAEFDSAAAAALIPLANEMRLVLGWEVLPTDGAVSTAHLGSDTIVQPSPGA